MDGFVLADDPENPTVLDGEFADGVFLVAEILTPIPGDINGDVVVDLADGIVALWVMTQMNHPIVHTHGDVNGDGKIGLPEAIYIMRKEAE